MTESKVRGSLKNAAPRPPTWLMIKSQIKAGLKDHGFGSGDAKEAGDASPEEPTTDRVASQMPAWLRVKSEIKAGGVDPPKSGLGPGESPQPPADAAASQPPAWLRVKSEIKAGGIEPPKSGDGPGESGPVSATLARLSARTKTHTL